MSELNKSVPQEKRVLSIQSHVVAGYAGNKAATFPMQLFEWEVDCAMTVEFSNHTGYSRWGGTRFGAEHLEDIFNAIDANGLFRQSHLLTGYVPGADPLKVVSRVVDRLKQINPNLVYVLDPVMGDDGRIYVSETVIPIYKDLIPKATCITPNYFEAELLSGIKVNNLDSLRHCLGFFHTEFGVPHVIISAVSLQRSELVERGVIRDDEFPGEERLLVCAGSSKTSDAPKQFCIVFPQLKEHYEGVGDVFSSLILCRSDLLPTHGLGHITTMAIASLQGILRNTREHAVKLAKGDLNSITPSMKESPEARVNRLRTVELRLVQSQKEILQPEVVHHTREL